MKIYIDKEFKCHTASDDGLTEAESTFFDYKSPEYIEGYRFIPAGQSWTREDGAVFTGEMVSPWKPWEELDAAQRAYERERVVTLEAQNAELLDAMASMVEDVYNQDVAVIKGE